MKATRSTATKTQEDSCRQGGSSTETSHFSAKNIEQRQPLRVSSRRPFSHAHFLLLLLLLFSKTTSTTAQQYDDYYDDEQQHGHGQGNAYEEYAARQQEVPMNGGTGGG